MTITIERVLIRGQLFTEDVQAEVLPAIQEAGQRQPDLSNNFFLPILF